MFSEMHVEEQRLVKLRVQIRPSRVSQLGFCGDSVLSCHKLARVEVQQHCSGLTWAISHPFGSIQPGSAGLDWSSMTPLLKGTPVIFISVYLTCNTGIAKTNIPKLSGIGSYVTNAGIPFVIAGDWTVVPSELLESSWPARIKGEILLPCDLGISCTSGRLIDYAVCQRSIVNIAKLQFR